MTAIAVEQLRGARVVRRREREIRRAVFRPRPTLSVSQWADKYGMLPRTTSAEFGRWRTDRAPYQRGIMDEISNPASEEQCWVAGHQVGKSALLLKALMYCVDQDPGPTLVVQPTLEFAREFSRDRLGPEIEITPRVRKQLKAGKGGRRESSDTLLRKEFDASYIALVGATSPMGVTSRPIRYIFGDEISKFPPKAGDKGDPLALAANRTENFFNRNQFYASTPGVLGVCRITQKWEESDQRYYFVPCPHCKEKQRLRWSDIEEHTGKRINFRVDVVTCRYTCEHCHTPIDEVHKTWMLANGEWRATRPAGSFPGFHLSSLYSPWQTWKRLVTKWLVAVKSKEQLKVFVNEELAEAWDPQDGEGISAEGLKARRETYNAEVPAGVGVLVAFIDVQRDWIELLVKGYGAGQESWLIGHWRIRGATDQDDVWQRADYHLTRAYQHESGATMRIAIAGVDSGDGDNVHPVYKFVGPRQRRAVCPVRATKGTSARGKPIIAGKPSKPNRKYGVRVHHIGTDTAKDIIFPRLRTERDKKTGATPPGYMHFCQAMANGEGADDEYLDQFAREVAVTKYTKQGIPFRVYDVVPPGARNEAIDLEVGCLRMLHELGSAVHDNLSRLVRRINDTGAKLTGRTPNVPVQTPAPSAPQPSPPRDGTEEEPPSSPPSAPPAPPKPPPPLPRPPQRFGSYINSWKR